MGNVISMVNELETAYGRDLAGTYEELFSSDFSKWWNKEYIWTIPGNGGSQGGGSEFRELSLRTKAGDNIMAGDRTNRLMIFTKKRC